MRRILGPLLLTTVLATGPLAGCGSDSDDPVAEDLSSTESGTPTGSPSEAPSPGGTGDVAFTEVALVTETAAGGDVEESATPLTDTDAVVQFSEQFTSDAMATELREAVVEADVPDDQVIVGAVVAVGCDVPPGVTVRETAEGLVITPLKVKDPQSECFAAMTTVALVMVDAGLV